MKTKIKNVQAGIRTRASRVAGENSTTEPQIHGLAETLPLYCTALFWRHNVQGLIIFEMSNVKCRVSDTSNDVFF